MSSGGLSAGVMLVLVLLGLLIAVLWVLLPFAVFGLKNLVRQAIAEQQRTSETLARIEAALRDRPPGK